MYPTFVLTAYLCFGVAASLHFPGCLPDEDATIVSQAIFQVPDPDVFTNLTLTYFTCPSRQAQLPQPVKEIQESTQAPIELCGIMDSSQIFTGGFIFNCTQATSDQPKLGDCFAIDTAVVDSLIRPMEVTIPALSGLVVSLLNNTCAFVFLNDDVNDDYQTCLHTIPDMVFDITEECPPARDGFIGSIRSPIEPGVQNWEARVVSSSFLNN